MDDVDQAPADPAEPFRLHGPRPDAVLLVHGFTSGPKSMRGWADHLAARGYTVSVPLLPGHGTRWQDLARTPHTAWSRAVAGEFDVLQRNHRFVFVCGLSMGGALALQLAAGRSVAGLALVNPGLTFGDRTAHLAPVLKYALASVPAIANDIALPGQDEGAYPRTPVAAVHQLGLLFRAARSGLGRVSAPVAVFRSAVDHVVPDSSIAVLRAGLPRPPRVDVLASSYHVATLDYDAEAAFARTAAFFDGLAGAPRPAGAPA
ncbi:alpha/beta hydrolase [Zafaria sp. Z1313]